MKVLSNNNLYQDMLQLFDEIEYKYPNVIKDEICYILAINACANINNIQKGEIIYNNISESERGINITAAFIDLCGQCSEIQKAESMFKMYHIPQHIIWINSMLTAYINNGYYKKALKLYDAVHINKTDAIYMLAIIACSKSKNFAKGNEIYLKIKGNNNIQIQTSLIDFFITFKDIKT
eukprot:183244_1